MTTPATAAGITILGSTGSIGVNTLDVIAQHPARYRVVALTANSSVDLMVEQCLRFRPDYAVMVDAAAARRLEERLHNQAPDVQVLSGVESGAAGLLPSLEAARQGKRVLLANKESLVMSGALFMNAVREHGATLLPIDSEHNAILQCLPGDYLTGVEPPGVRRILLTASGGPFRTLPPARLAAVTPEQACAHPNWVMGRKISVDSATMMNKC